MIWVELRSNYSRSGKVTWFFVCCSYLSIITMLAVYTSKCFELLFLALLFPNDLDNRHTTNVGILKPI